MAEYRIVLVGPKFPGNVGAVARSMANFGLRDLVLVNPSCELDDDAYRRSKHGSFILDSARAVGTLEEALDGCFLVAGTSGVTTKGDSNYTRIPVPVREFAESTRGYGDRIALVFGREDIGLLQEELEKCDVLVWVPTSDDFPILNLSHAATIAMYEMYQADHVPRRTLPASREQKERMFSTFDDLMEEVAYPVNRRHGTRVMFRRMMGRSIPSEYEFRTIMGVFADAVKIIRNGRPWEKKERSGERSEHDDPVGVGVVPPEHVGQDARPEHGRRPDLVDLGSGASGADGDHQLPYRRRHRERHLPQSRAHRVGHHHGVDIGEGVPRTREGGEERPVQQLQHAVQCERGRMGQDPEHGIEPRIGIARVQGGLDVQCDDAIDYPVQLRELLHGRRPADIEFGRYPHDGHGPASVGRCCDQHLAEILRGSSA